MKIFTRLTIVLLVTIVLFSCETKDYTLWQLDTVTPAQANLYVMRTPNNKTIVIKPIGKSLTGSLKRHKN